MHCRGAVRPNNSNSLAVCVSGHPGLKQSRVFAEFVWWLLTQHQMLPTLRPSQPTGPVSPPVAAAIHITVAVYFYYSPQKLILVLPSLWGWKAELSGTAVKVSNVCKRLYIAVVVCHIHLHGLHLNAQYGQTWHLSTQWRSQERTGRRLLWSTTLLLPTLLSDSQVSISLTIHGLWWTVSGQVKAHVLLTCANGVSPNHLPVIVASDRPWTTLSTRAH